MRHLLCWATLLSAAACSTGVGQEGVLVLVEFDRDALQSRCVKVFAADGAGQTRETMAMSLMGAESPLRVAIVSPAGTTVRVVARGFRDEGCGDAVPDEVSDEQETRGGSPAPEVRLRLRGSSSNDGGVRPDGGADAGFDAGVDAGLDLDGDGVPQPADCNDQNPAVRPGLPELCANGFDDDCDGLSDCSAPTCAAMSCTGGGTCRDAGCVSSSEVLCNDGFDNDLDGFTDCRDSDCAVGAMCDDLNGCTLGETCASDAGCQSTTMKACNSPPGACYDMAGTCLPDAGAVCEYLPRTGSCDDTLACTDNDTCTGVTCMGTPRTCPPPTNACLLNAGCQEPGGTCAYPPRPSGPCDDNDNCTIGDACDGDGGCLGTPVTCTPPTECHQAAGCSDGGACLFAARTGQACDGGAGVAGLCASNFACVTTFASCLDLFLAQPATSTGDYLIDPDGPGGGVGFMARCEMSAGDAGWTVISFEDFTDDAGGWSDRRRDTSGDCTGNTGGGTILGGPGLFGSGLTVSKTYSFLSVPHTSVHVTLDYYVIDSWDNERARVLGDDGGFLYDQQFSWAGASDVCGAAWGDRLRQLVSARVAHPADTFRLSVTSTLNESANNESFGIDNVKVLVR